MSDLYRELMRHEAPNPHRRKTPKWPIRVTPPRCDVCTKQLHPDIDHSICKETS